MNQSINVSTPSSNACRAWITRGLGEDDAVME